MTLILKSCSVGADGSVFTKYPHFGTRLQSALIEIFGEETGKQIVMKGAEDGSGYRYLFVLFTIAIRRSGSL